MIYYGNNLIQKVYFNGILYNIKIIQSILNDEEFLLSFDDKVLTDIDDIYLLPKIDNIKKRLLSSDAKILKTLNGVYISPKQKS